MRGKTRTLRLLHVMSPRFNEAPLLCGERRPAIIEYCDYFRRFNEAPLLCGERPHVIAAVGRKAFRASMRPRFYAGKDVEAEEQAAQDVAASMRPRFYAGKDRGAQTGLTCRASRLQ